MHFMTNTTAVGTTGGTLLSLLMINANTIFATAIVAGVGATVSFFVSLFFKWLMSDLDERIEIQRKLKALIPIIKRKHREERNLNKKIDEINKIKKK